MNTVDTEILHEFGSISKKDFTKEWESLIWLLSSECGWSQEDVLNAEIPYVISLLNGRSRAFKEQEKQLKRRK